MLGCKLQQHERHSNRGVAVSVCRYVCVCVGKCVCRYVYVCVSEHGREGRAGPSANVCHNQAKVLARTWEHCVQRIQRCVPYDRGAHYIAEHSSHQDASQQRPRVYNEHC